ncbi:MAG TPA: SAM-dependent chlorinase/fluorinase [Verrucomicrobiae bacterium]
MSVITLTTDFSTSDWFVSTMKGVILSIEPRTHIVDITHEIAPGDIRAGAFALMAATPYFPKNSIHVAVVDPGVGSERRAIAIQTDKATFIGPDNGLLTWALRDHNIRSARQITNEKYFQKPVSRTFHGRDIFSPVAAHLAAGKKFSTLGPKIESWGELPWPTPKRSAQTIQGEILHIDRFGNAITNIAHNSLTEEEWQRADIRIKKHSLGAPKASYSEAKRGTVLAILSSTGFLEIAINGGSVAKHLKLQVGNKLSVFF